MKKKIVIACHKACEVPSSSLYLPLHVGSRGKEEIEGFARDDGGDQISGKNPFYCELTGLYWAWKNLDTDVLGLVHYRRYFARRGRRHREAPFLDLLDEADVSRLLADHKVLVPRKRHYYIESVYTHYAHTFDSRHFDEARKILGDLAPDYLGAFDRFMAGTSAYLYNMYIMPKGLSDAYCEWLFPILDRLFDRIDTGSMTDFEKRYIGRVSERLFNVWLLGQIDLGRLTREDIAEVPYLYIGRVDWGRKISGFLRAKFLHRKYDKSF